MISAFGVDHGEVSKALGGNFKPMMGNLAPMGKLTAASRGGVGAGTTPAKSIAGAFTKPGGPSAGGYQAGRAQAKQSGQQAGRMLAQGQSPHSPNVQSASNAGLQSKAKSWGALGQQGPGARSSYPNKPAPGPAGMRGPIGPRANTTQQRNTRWY